MNRLKLLAAAMLLAVPIACGDEVLPPPPTGSIDGLVSIEGQGIDAVSVTLSNGASAITANGGMYRFDGVEAGAYTVTISNYPDDASFNQTSAAATIATDGQNVTVNFPGSWIRTSSIMGTVTVENEGLGGVTVKLSGVSDSETLTDAGGQYAFTGLRAGNYTVEITGFDDEDVAFGSTSSAATVATGESKVVSFEGTYLRTSGIVGQVTADEEPQEGIAVSLQGRGESRTVSTNGAGQFSFEQLRRGDYSVVISGYDTDEMTFDVTSQSVTVAYGETANVPFEGTLLRTAGIAGTVTVEGVGPIANVTVTINGEGETLERTTDHMGAYAFGGLHAGDYSVAISGFDDDEYGFPDGTSATVTVELQETGSVPFDGIMLRTAAIEGTVTVGDDDAPLPGVMVTVSGGPRDEEHATTTNNDGMYMVENLHAGTYSVTISGYDTREYGFDPTTRMLTVDLRDTGEAAFQGELLRTAGVSGRVHVGGMGLPGVTVKLTGEESREGNTNADGQYAFAGLAAGDYTLTISGWDEVEYHFEPTMEITLELDETRTGQNFAGRALRTATVMGYVTVEGDALPDITVALLQFTGENTIEVLDDVMTDADGAYAFGPLLAGAYLVSIVEGYTDEHEFAEMESFVAVETDGTATVNFAATIIRTAGVSGKVEVEGEALADVEVTLTGEHAPEDNTMETGDDGMYEFGDLRKGDYTVSITKLPNADAYNFPSMSRDVNLSVGQDQPGISFAGELVRSAGVSGRVHVDGNGLAGVTVTLDGPDSHDPETTDANGQYGFSGLAAGDYTVTISGWDEVEYRFEPTMEISLELDESMSGANFAGRALRTATVMGYVTVEGEALADVEVTLTGEHAPEDNTMETGDDGGYSFGPLLAGAYRVMIAGYDDEHDFAAVDQTTAVDTDSTATVDFAATIIRTAGVSGMVTVDGDAMAGVEVTLGGDHAPEDNTMTTGDDGMYEFSGLRKGDYTVTMENPDDNLYNFPSTERGPVNLSVGQMQEDISFAGTSLRRGSISGQVHAEGEPIEGVTVTLSGDALDEDQTDMTDGNGEYNFPGLAVGEYEVTIDDPGDAYDFSGETLTKPSEIVDNDDFNIVDFAGMHARTAMVTGKLFIDEGPDPGEYHSSEPMLDATWAGYVAKELSAALQATGYNGIPLVLEGPGLDDADTLISAGSDGSYTFPGLVKGTYKVRVDLDIEIPALIRAALPPGVLPDAIETPRQALTEAGYELDDEDAMSVTVEATGDKSVGTVDFPFKITKQTINVGAVMGYASDGIADDDRTKVEGVTLTLYATAEDANAEENALTTMTTGAMGSEDEPNPNHGVATFEFAREKDKGPGGQDNDHLVFAKVVEKHEDLEFADNRAIEIQYPATARESDALAAARLVNVQVDILWRVMRNADSKDGADENSDPHRLGGWHVVMGEGEDATTHTTADSADMEVAAADHGKATLSERLESVADAIDGKTYWIALDEDVEDPVHNAMQPDMDEDWDQSAALEHEHDHLALPSKEAVDIGVLHVTWTTQKLTVGVYREADDTDGFTDFRSALPTGDHRPHGDVAAEMEVELLIRDTRGRLDRFEWDPHPVTGENRREGLKNVGRNGMVTFHRIPAETEITVRFKPGTERKQIDYGYDEIEAFNDPDDTRHNDLTDFGVTLGAFGEESGGRPEVKMCSASADDQVRPRPDMPLSDEWCATFAYQWETGMVHGEVGSEKDHTVKVEPETGQGAIGDDAETAADGGYSIDDLQDGEYKATATAVGSTHRLTDPDNAEVRGIELYHNEACWAATNPPVTTKPDANICGPDDYLIEETNDAGDKTYQYANRQERNWDTERIGLSIKGYVANDGQDGEPGDNLLRGDELLEGIEMTLKRTGHPDRTAMTLASGLYSFDDLPEGTYTVHAGSATNAIALHEIRRNSAGTAWEPVTSKPAEAQQYPTFPAEQDVDKPYWARSSLDADGNHEANEMKHGTTTVTGNTPPITATLYNFALVYTDGQLTGSVNNLSGSNASIDILLTSPIPGEDIRKTDTKGRTGGTFEYGGLTEGIDYTAEIEDKDFAAPCMGAGGTPDDELEDEDGTCGVDDNNDPNPRFPTELMADIEGENDHESMGILTVYNTDMSRSDELTDLSVEGTTSTGEDAEAEELSTYEYDPSSPPEQDASGTTDIASSVTATPAITWASATVTVLATVSADASYTVKVGTGRPVVPHVTRGAPVTLPFNATGSADAGDAFASTITVEVTAENSYNDHSYAFSVSRAAPVGYGLTSGDVAGADGAADGLSLQNAWTATTDDAATTTITITVDLQEISESTECGQTLVVKDGDTVKDRDADSSACAPEYTLTALADGNLHTLEVTSQDNETETYYLWVNLGG